MAGIDGIGAVGTNPFSNMEWLSASKGAEETGGTLASLGTEETGGTLASSEGNLFDGQIAYGADNGLFADKQEETSGQLASSGSFCAVA